MKSSTEVKGIPCIFIYMKHDNCSSTNDTVILLQLYMHCIKYLRIATERGFRVHIYIYKIRALSIYKQDKSSPSLSLYTYIGALQLSSTARTH